MKIKLPTIEVTEGQALDFWLSLEDLAGGEQIRKEIALQLKGVVCLDCDGTGAVECVGCHKYMLRSDTRVDNCGERDHSEGLRPCDACKGEGHFIGEDKEADND